MRATVLVLLTLTTAIGPALPSGLAGGPAPYDLAMGPGDVHTFDLDDTGWALVHITATAPINLNFTLRHDTIDDLCVFSSDGDGIYDQGHVTAFFLRELDGGGSESFAWHGIPGWSVWPDQSGECGVSGDIALGAGERADLIAADTVGGYTVTLRATAAPEEAPSEPLQLAPHAGFRRVDPQPLILGGVQAAGATAAYQQEWRETFTLGEAWLMLSDWDKHDGDPIAVHAAMVSQSRGVVAPGTSPEQPQATDLPGPEFHIAGAAYGRGTQSLLWDDPGDWDLVYTATRTGVSTPGDFAVGAYFIAIPFAP